MISLTFESCLWCVSFTRVKCFVESLFIFSFSSHFSKKNQKSPMSSPKWRHWRHRCCHWRHHQLRFLLALFVLSFLLLFVRQCYLFFPLLSSLFRFLVFTFACLTCGSTGRGYCVLCHVVTSVDWSPHVLVVVCLQLSSCWPHFLSSHSGCGLFWLLFVRLFRLCWFAALSTLTLFLALTWDSSLFCIGCQILTPLIPHLLSRSTVLLDSAAYLVSKRLCASSRISPMFLRFVAFV